MPRLRRLSLWLQGIISVTGNADFRVPILPPEGLSLNRLLSDIEDSLVRQALAAGNGNHAQSARLLRMNRTTLLAKMRKMGIPLKRSTRARAGESA